MDHKCTNCNEGEQYKDTDYCQDCNEINFLKKAFFTAAFIVSSGTLYGVILLMLLSKST